jgi:hypothetical protein
LCRQQRANLRCVAITRGFPKLLPRHDVSRSLPSLLKIIYLQLVWTKCAPQALICKQELAM